MLTGKNKRAAPNKKEDVPHPAAKKGPCDCDEIESEVVERCDILADVDTPQNHENGNIIPQNGNNNTSWPNIVDFEAF